MLSDLADSGVVEDYVFEHWDALWDDQENMFRRGSTGVLIAQFPELTPQQIRYRLRKLREARPETFGEGAPGVHSTVSGIPRANTPVFSDSSEEEDEFHQEEITMESPRQELEDVPSTVHELITGVYSDKEGEKLNKIEIRLMALCAELMFEVERLSFELEKVTTRR